MLLHQQILLLDHLGGLIKYFHSIFIVHAVVKKDYMMKTFKIIFQGAEAGCLFFLVFFFLFSLYPICSLPSCVSAIPRSFPQLVSISQSVCHIHLHPVPISPGIAAATSLISPRPHNSSAFFTP